MIYTCKPARVGIYVNTQKKTMDEVKEETKADVIINGGLYNPNFTPCCHLKVNGQVIGADQWTYFGYGWHQDKADLQMVSDYSALDNYICCVCLLRNGQKEQLLYPSEMGGKRPRTAIGLYPDGRVWFYASSEGKTPEGLQTLAQSLGLESALMLDGGGSTQGICPTSSYRQSRRVHNFILAWLENSEPLCPYPEPSALIYRGNRGTGVKWLQFMLNRHGAKLVVDGIYGGMTYAAVITFQMSHGLIADGIVGSLTRAKLKENPKTADIIQPDYVWSRQPAKRASTQFIILHHAGVTQATPESIHTYHKSLGWCGIGYNLYVSKDGKVYHGRPIDTVGAHTVGYNATSVGICFEGNFEIEQMSPVQIEAGKRAIDYAKSYYPNTTIKLHKECDATACPGRYFPADQLR